MKLLILLLIATGLFAQTPACNIRAPITVTASGTTTVIPAITGLAVHVCTSASRTIAKTE